MNYNINKLTKALKKHAYYYFWIGDASKRADLSGAYLSGAEARHG